MEHICNKFSMVRGRGVGPRCWPSRVGLLFYVFGALPVGGEKLLPFRLSQDPRRRGGAVVCICTCALAAWRVIILCFLYFGHY